MKKIIVLIVLFTCFLGFSQNNETLKTDVKKMYDASYNMAFDEVMQYTYPKIFEIAPREQVAAAIENAFDNEEMKIRFVHVNPTFTYSEIKKIDNKSVCLVKYKSAMRMTFERKLEAAEVEAFTKAFNESGEYEKSTFEQDRNSFFLEGDAAMIAVADESTKGKWTFVNYSKSQAQLAEMLLGANVLKELGL